MNGAFSIVPKKSSPHLRSSQFSLILSPRSFKVLCFMFGSMIHFELIFVRGVRSVPYTDLRFSFFFFFACGCPIVLEPLVEKIIFAPSYCLYPLIKDQLTIFVEPVCVLYSVPLIYLSFLSPNRHCLDL